MTPREKAEQVIREIRKICVEHNCVLADEIDILKMLETEMNQQQTEEKEDEQENETAWSLRDEGRSDGQGESYSERNT